MLKISCIIVLLYLALLLYMWVPLCSLVGLCRVDRVGKGGGKLGVVCLKRDVRIAEDKIQEGLVLARDRETILAPVLYHFEVLNTIITVVRRRRKRRKRRRRKKRKRRRRRRKKRRRKRRKKRRRKRKRKGKDVVNKDPEMRIALLNPSTETADPYTKIPEFDSVTILDPSLLTLLLDPLLLTYY